YTTIRRLGGRMQLYNLPRGGACVEIILPLINDTNYDDTQ
ncbi:MAG: hypothetical protein RL637_1689, partial [Pseudomonadota bacterium]